jgi:hypothetical protein
LLALSLVSANILGVLGNARSAALCGASECSCSRAAEITPSGSETDRIALAEFLAPTLQIALAPARSKVLSRTLTAPRQTRKERKGNCNFAHRADSLVLRKRCVAMRRGQPRRLKRIIETCLAFLSEKLEQTWSVARRYVRSFSRFRAQIAPGKVTANCANRDGRE